MKTFLTAPALFLTLALSAQLPNSEVWVFESDLLTGSHTIGKGINVSNHPGYDNEPSFPPNSKFLLWSSECDPGQTDICYYDFDDDSVMRITHIKVSEYSPAYMFGGQFISAVVVEADSTQRMWKYDYDRGAGQVMFPRVTGVAYYTWFDKQFVVMDQLTQNDSMNLLVGDAKAGVARLCVRNVGRCVQCYNSSSVKKILYTKEDTIGKFFIHAMFISGNNYDDFDPIPMLPGSQDFAVDYNGDILAAKGTELYIWNINTSDNWEKIADFSASGLHSITRIAISPDGRWVAVVDNP